MNPDSAAAWLALAFRTALPSVELREIALGKGPDPDAFPAETLAREREDFERMGELGGALLTIRDAEYPERLRRSERAPLVLSVAGRAGLLEEEGVHYAGRLRGAEGEQVQEALESGGRVVVVLSKGLLKAKTLLRGLGEAIADGAVTLVSAEPPRAAWGPVRDLRRDSVLGLLAGRNRA